MIVLADKAHEIAQKAHFGQVDKAGVDYIKHPEAVASFVVTDEEKAVAYLHDVLEDTEVTLEFLREHGFPQKILTAVDVLTKKKGQDYEDYLAVVKSNELARVVKLADLRHNSDLTRLSQVTQKDLNRCKKYQDAINYLST
ncbi:(p)ppGpp synthase/HD superfamily hydrolase [Streptococcus rupicaprae]|uniref:(P)ppGpp synthase/HD superfamily hydrolase n=1 Tax=Streptococcus rupicaprae TaxID=759619 RepID=A0ABV2FJD9_9STRE